MPNQRCLGGEVLVGLLHVLEGMLLHFALVALDALGALGGFADGIFEVVAVWGGEVHRQDVCATDAGTGRDARDAGKRGIMNLNRSKGSNKWR